MRRILVYLITALVLAGAAPAYAVQPDEIMSNPALEARARDLSRQLRCMVCQNQSIDDSDAELARDLRLLLRERLKAGDSDQQARQFLVDRYGDYVLLKPPFKTATLALWLGTPVLLLGGSFLAWSTARKRRPKEAAPLTAEEKARLDKLLS